MIDRLQRAFRMARWLLTITAQTLFLSIALLFVAPPRKNVYRALVQQKRITTLLRILKVKVRLVGAFPDRPHLISSNHLGTVDPWILGAQLPAAFAAKAEMSGWPLAGWICRTVGIIFVDRAQRMRAGDFSQAIRDRLDEGVSVIVFPEGTTTNGSKVLPFKTGAFDAVAGHAGRAVLPVCINVVSINGTQVDMTGAEFMTWADGRQEMLENLWDIVGIRSAEVELVIGTPIEAGSLDRKQLAEQARDQVVAMNRWIGSRDAGSPTEASSKDNSAHISVDSRSPEKDRSFG